jgi:hypothetical protein
MYIYLTFNDYMSCCILCVVMFVIVSKSDFFSMRGKIWK